MNLPKFLKEVDHIAESASKEELSRFIHDIARTLPEERRAEFLGRFRTMHKTEPRSEQENEGSRVPQGYDILRTKLTRIKEGDLRLVGSLNEEYDDWYNSAADEFLFEDPDGVLDVIEDAIEFVHQCVKCGDDKAGYEIAKQLVGLQIMVGGEYLEYDDTPLDINELGYYHLSDLDYKSLVIDAAYLTYRANALPERAAAVYDIIEHSGRNDITLETMMQNGEELPEIGKFLEIWIAYLGGLTSGNAQKLLKEAVELINDPEQCLENARKYHVQHPALYEQYILGNLGQADDMELYEVGREALETIEQKYVVRSRVALLMSRIALGHGMEEAAENCWVEAFRSDTRVVNYLRLSMECSDFSKIKDETDKICHDLYARFDAREYFRNTEDERKENRVNTATVYMLAFFGGEFQYVADNAMNVKSPVGWSSTFMKCGLAAFLLLLFDGDALMQGCKEMCHKVVAATGFSKEEYQQGLLKTIDEENEAWFWQCFSHWKKTVSLSEEEKENFVHWAETLIKKRVQGIMNGNYRKYYGECAGYIAALGEVKESRGEINGKQKTMQEYRALYSRRSAFHGELNVYGMKDCRR